MKIKKDMLTCIFDKQIKLQLNLNNNVNSQHFITHMALATIDEVMEALRETPWKPWKKNQSFNSEKFKDEIIDIQHFVINLAISSGMDAKEFYDRFLSKNNINKNRIKGGY